MVPHTETIGRHQRLYKSYLRGMLPSLLLLGSTVIPSQNLCLLFGHLAVTSTSGQLHFDPAKTSGLIS